VQRTPLFAVPATARAAARAAARAGWRGLIQVLTAPDPVPAWLPRNLSQRRAVYCALAAAAVVLDVGSLANGPGSQDQVIRPALPGHPLQIHQSVVGVARPLEALLVALVVLPVLLAARYPLLSWRIAGIAFLLVPLSQSYWWGAWPWYPVQLPILLVVFCVAGLRQQRAVLWWMWALTLASWWLWSGQHRPDVVAHLLGSVALTALTVVVDSMSSRRHAERAMTVLAQQTERKQAQLTVLEERARIARELHDVVAHHMSLIAVRAESAPFRLDNLPDPVCAEFSELSAAARDALTDMRRLLGVLRQDKRADRAPQPQLSDLPVLIEAARHAGVPVEFSVPGDLAGVPAGVGVCAYRIVQESLSNAGQHAPGAAVSVSVGQDAGAVVLRVVNGPGALPQSQHGAHPAPPSRDGLRPGHGLAGMRERVALLGGTLSAEPSAGGGFVVSAVLPLGGLLNAS
jgi:signal transduction histidine kinase